MAGEFPRIRDNSFAYSSTLKIPDRLAGRLDLLCTEMYGTPMLYKVIAAANGISNSMALRATIRPMDESVRNELILRGYTGAELEREYRKAMDEVVGGRFDWLGYDNLADGTITEAGANRRLLVPDAASGTEWFEKYGTAG